jgi:hypothetical protein
MQRIPTYDCSIQCTACTLVTLVEVGIASVVAIKVCDFTRASIVTYFGLTDETTTASALVAIVR